MFPNEPTRQLSEMFLSNVQGNHIFLCDLFAKKIVCCLFPNASLSVILSKGVMSNLLLSVKDLRTTFRD